MEKLDKSPAAISLYGIRQSIQARYVPGMVNVNLTQTLPAYGIINNCRFYNNDTGTPGSTFTVIINQPFCDFPG
jgi:hypothetical protein